ncbi:Mitochondrial group I intron splicing factor ccm1, partial [Clydaea vesicula]
NLDADPLSAALFKPVEHHVSENTNLKLQSTFIRNLNVNYENTSDFTKSTKIEVLKEKLKDIGQDSLNITNFTNLVRLNALMNKPEQAEASFDLLRKAKLEPTTEILNHLLNAYARVGDTKNCDKVFSIFEEKGLKPNQYTCGIYINGLIVGGKLEQAILQEVSWRKSGIEIPETVYTSIIKGCVKKKDFRKAWSMFEFLQSNYNTPDIKTYSLMLHTCALNKEAEKALELFQQMTEKDIKPSSTTLNSLIKACGSRLDYYAESFQIFQQFCLEGFKPQVDTYNHLLDICAVHGDLERAQMVWNDLCDRYISENHDLNLKPNAMTCMAMIKVFNRFLKLRVGRDLKIKVPAITSKYESNVPLLENEEFHYRFSEINTKKVQILKEVKRFWCFIGGVDTFVFDKKKLDGKPHLSSDGVEDSTVETVKETNVANDVEHRSNRETLVDIDVKMLNNLLACFANSDLNISQKIINLFDNLFSHYNASPNGKSYQLVLSSLTRQKYSMNNGTALNFWKKFLEWDEKIEDDSLKMLINCDQVKYKKIATATLKSSVEMEDIRRTQFRSKEYMFQNFLAVVKGYSLINDFDNALATIEQSKKFRCSNYLEEIRFKNIRGFIDKSYNMALDGDLGIAKKLVQICPKPAKDDEAQIRNILYEKNFSKNWWGFNALGVGKARRMAMIEAIRKKRK